MDVNPDFHARARKIVIMAVDVDGTLTDGRVLVHADGSESLSFSRRDGMGFKRWQQNGGIVAVVTQEDAPAVRHRMLKLAVDHYLPGIHDKVAAVEKVCREYGLSAEHCAFVGDDVNDRDALAFVGLGFAVADAQESVKQAADIVLDLPGGHGAVREAVEWLLPFDDARRALRRPVEAPS